VAELIDGRTEEITVHQPRGHPDAPLSEAELAQKMTWLLEDLASPDTPGRLLELCIRLSTPEDVNELVEACRVTKS
jgi:2-methylcitrate dehydratase PrpD